MEWRLVRDQLEWKIVSDGMQCVLQLNFWLRFAEFLVLSPIPDPYGTRVRVYTYSLTINMQYMRLL